MTLSRSQLVPRSAVAAMIADGWTVRYWMPGAYRQDEECAVMDWTNEAA